MNEINIPRIADPAAIAAAVARAENQVDQGKVNIDSANVPQEIHVQFPQDFPPIQGRQQAESGGSSSGRGHFSLFGNMNPRAPSRRSAAASSSFPSRGEINDIKQTKSHTETAECYLRYKYEAEKLRTEVLQLQDEIETQKGMNETLMAQLEGQDFTVRKAQESAFAVVALSGPRAEDDDVIRSRLKTATSRWKQFAKKWASKSLVDLKDEHIELLEPLFEDFVHSKILADDEGDSPDGIFERDHDRKAPSILLNAELARFVVINLLEQPFTAAFTFGAVSGSDSESTTGSVMQTLQSIYHHMLQGRWSILLLLQNANEPDTWQMTQLLRTPGVRRPLAHSIHQSISFVPPITEERETPKGQSKPIAEDLSQSSKLLKQKLCIVNVAKTRCSIVGRSFLRYFGSVQMSSPLCGPKKLLFRLLIAINS